MLGIMPISSLQSLEIHLPQVACTRSGSLSKGRKAKCVVWVEHSIQLFIFFRNSGGCDLQDSHFKTKKQLACVWVWICNGACTCTSFDASVSQDLRHSGRAENETIGSLKMQHRSYSILHPLYPVNFCGRQIYMPNCFLKLLGHIEANQCCEI